MRRPVLAAAISALSLAGASTAQTGVPVTAPGNPILADGRYYSTDPAPIVDGDTLWILAGRDRRRRASTTSS